MILKRRSFLATAILGGGVAGSSILPSFSTSSMAENSPWSIIAPEDKRTFSINGAVAQGTKFGIGSTTIKVRPDAREAYIRLTYDLPSIDFTAIVDVRAADLGEGINPAHVDVSPASVVWRPGDDRDHWVTVKFNQATPVGSRLMLYLNANGFVRSGALVIEIDKDGDNLPPSTIPHHRSPIRLGDLGKPNHDLDMSSVRWSDSGFSGQAKPGNACWRSRLSHGYSQMGNGENGLYMNSEVFPAAVNPLSVAIDQSGKKFVRLHSAKLNQPVLFEGKSYPFQAAVLQGQYLDQWCHRTGIYEADIQAPSQRGAWAGFWLIGRDARGRAIWPPEIDCCEFFNGAFGGEYTPRSVSSGQHVGRHGSIKRANRFTLQVELDKLIQEGAHFNLNSEITRHSCVIDDMWIIHFVNGIETIAYRNMTGSVKGDENWAFFPILTVGVKADPAMAYAEGEEADLRWYGLRYYGAETIVRGITSQISS